MPLPPEQQARELLADAIAAQGAAWINTANLIRHSQFTNLWLTPALAALAGLIRQLPQDEE